MPISLPTEFSINFQSLKNATEQLRQQFSPLSEQAKETLNQTKNQAANTVSETTNQAINSVNQITEKAKNSLQNTFGPVENLNRNLSENIQSMISQSVDQWMHNHPRLIWLVQHPLETLGLIILGFFLISGLLKAITRLSEKIWVTLFTSPVKLISSGFGLMTKFSQNQNQKLEIILGGNQKQQRISLILSRLEALKQEQDVLLQELTGLLKSNQK